MSDETSKDSSPQPAGKYDSQDPDVHDLGIELLHRLDMNAEVRETFVQLGKPEELRYDLVDDVRETRGITIRGSCQKFSC